MPSRVEQINKPGPKFAFDDCFLYERRCHSGSTRPGKALDWLISAVAATGHVRVISTMRDDSLARLAWSHAYFIISH